MDILQEYQLEDQHEKYDVLPGAPNYETDHSQDPNVSSNVVSIFAETSFPNVIYSSITDEGSSIIEERESGLYRNDDHDSLYLERKVNSSISALTQKSRLRRTQLQVGPEYDIFLSYRVLFPLVLYFKMCNSCSPHSYEIVLSIWSFHPLRYFAKFDISLNIIWSQLKW